MYVVYGSGELVPPPGDGVVTVTLKFPGIATLEAGRVAVSCVAFTRVDAIGCPFSATVELVVNPVPVEGHSGDCVNGPGAGRE